MEPDTPFIFKKDLKLDFSTNANFFDFFNHNSIFFDKTLMIKDILERNIHKVKL